MIVSTVLPCAIVSAILVVLLLHARSRLCECRRRLASAERGRSAALLAAQAAEAATARLREMLDALPLPVWRRDGVLTDCNRAYAEALGSTRERVLAEARELSPRLGRGGIAATGTVSGDDADDAGPAELSSDPAMRTHVVIGGQRRLLELVERPCASGGSGGVAVDKTDLESAQSELWRHINAHADVLESIYAAVAIFGPDRRLSFFNTAFAALWEIEEAWLATEPSLDEILERLRESRNIPEFADFRAFKHERCEMFTALIEPRHEVMHLPDGRTVQVTVSPHPLGGLTFVYEDVSDRLALECSYNTLIQVQRATLDHLFEGVAVYGSDGRLKLHNPAFRAMWGLSSEDVAGDPHIADIVERTRDFLDDGSDWPAVRDAIVAKVTSPSLASGPLYRRDGSMLQVASVPLPDGEVLLSYLDVTDTSRVERALRQRNEALETADRLKSEFIAGVSHELRTPLSTVIGFAEILNHQYFGALNSSQSEYCYGILESAHQLMTLIDDILDLAMIEAGHLVLERSPVDIAGMLQAVVKLTQERARSRGLDLQSRCPMHFEPIAADERRLKQALFNLVSNAIKFTPPGGSISIEAACCDGDLCISVTDTGPGVAAPEQPGETVAPARRQASSGLGLSLVRNLIELHGGTVEIRPAPGRGTQIICRLPAFADSPAPAPPGDLPRLEPSGRDRHPGSRAAPGSVRLASGASANQRSSAV
ncbi:MAG TPA: ATP-binding protein [Stellaceae bacterium]|nr:ATP-binding protein [Stellaceae bacterium]